MHLFDAATRFYGGNAIVGGGLPLSLGLAMADKMQGKARVTCCFFGDGAVAEGAFHESMNIASLWKLPVLFVCENNLYAMGTAIRYTQAVQDLASKGAGYGVLSSSVDGMDVLAVGEAARKATDYVRQGNGPYFLECRTYRFRPHSMFDTELYRTREEVTEWKKRDPIDSLSRRLKDYLFNDQEMACLEREVAGEVEAAVVFAEAGTWEPIEELTRFVYSEKRVS
jgi:pyruvate dehydrogenase E1 component alpha subunit/2-oxoisovalerate dehydrogenase E1 component